MLDKSGIHIKFTNNGLISLYLKTRVPIQICEIADNVVQLINNNNNNLFSYDMCH